MRHRGRQSEARALRHAVALLGATGLMGWTLGASAMSDHSLGPGYRWTHLSAERLSPVDLHAASLQYSLFTGERFGFVMVAEALWPLEGAQQGHTFWLPGTYDTVMGVDVLLGGGARFKLSPRWSLWAGLGPHLNGVKLTQKELRSFDSLTLGVGGVVAPRYRMLDWLDLGANVSPGLDFEDLIHSVHGLSWASHVGLSVVLSIRLDRIEGAPAVRDPDAPAPPPGQAPPQGGQP